MLKMKSILEIFIQFALYYTIMQTNVLSCSYQYGVSQLMSWLGSLITLAAIISSCEVYTKVCVYTGVYVRGSVRKF